MQSILHEFKWKQIILCTILIILFLTFEVIYLLFGVDFNNLTFNQYINLSLIKYFFFLILLVLLYHKYLKEKWIDFKKNFKNYFIISLKDWVTGFFIMSWSNIVISLFINNLGENENIVQNIISTSPIIAFSMTTFFAPFIEEMIFRKSLKDCFKNYKLYMVISGILFGLIHVLGSSNPLEYLLIIPYGALGFMFAHTISKTDNIYCTIMMHMIHNGLLTILALVAR